MDGLISFLAQAGLPGFVFGLLYFATRSERDIKNETIAQLREERDHWRRRALEAEGFLEPS